MRIRRIELDQIKLKEIELETKSRITQFLEPLCDATKNLFRSVDLFPNDRLHLSLSADGESFRVSIYAEGEGNFPSYHASGSWIARIPERKRIDSNVYEFAATDFTAFIIHAVWPKEKLVFDAQAKIKYNYILTNFLNQTTQAEVVAKFKKDKTIPDFNFLDSELLPLADYQKIGLYCAQRNEGYALFMEQGTGKTPIAIARICNEAKRRKRKRLYRTIIVCPKNVCLNWRNEFIRFATVPGKISVLRGTALDRMKLLIEAFQQPPEDNSKWTAVVCSYETLARSWDALKMVEWDLGILDESHFIKSTETKRYRQVLKLRDLCDTRMCLTGTPIANSLIDIYAQFEFLYSGASGFKSFKKFKNYYSRYETRGSRKVITGYQNLPMIQERLCRFSFMITKAEALPDLPDKVYDIHEAYMGPEQSQVYKDIRDKLIVEIKNDLDKAENKSLVITNCLTKLLRLAQITSGFITWDAVYDNSGVEIKPKIVDRFDPNPKLEALIDLLRDKQPYEKTIIWACWRQDIKSISARLELEKIDAVTFYGATSDKNREIAERRFNSDSKCKVFIGNPAAGGTGLNLLGYLPDNPSDPHTCNHEIYFSQNWSYIYRSQSEDRAHRRGTKENVRITDLCIPGTIDEEIRARVLEKKLSAYKIQDVRNILSRILESSPED